MKLIKLAIFVIFFMLHEPTNAQSKYFELNNRDAIVLDDTTLHKLTSGYWRVFKEDLVNKGNVRSSPKNISICYYPNRTFLFNGTRGTWKIIENKYIEHEMDEASEAKLNFGGIFSITELKDSTLKLTKLLTSSHDMERTLHLKPSTVLTTTEQQNNGYPYLYNGILNESIIDSLSQMNKDELFNVGITVKSQEDYNMIHMIAFDTLFIIKTNGYKYQYEKLPLKATTKE
ncbi:MAG: hypothetical protein WA958_01580 [Tunicatimonas sp.]